VSIPVIEQVKAQAQVLVPLVRALRAELGEARANDIVRRALAEQYRKLGERWWRRQQAAGLGDRMAESFARFAADDALDYDVVRQTPEAFDLDVTGCRYAEFYKAMGAPELGFLLVCSGDFAMAEGFGGEVELRRTQTIMQGARHCDFRYALKPAAPEARYPLRKGRRHPGLSSADTPAASTRTIGVSNTADSRPGSSVSRVRPSAVRRPRSTMATRSA
jgi:hypothetical protein